MTETIDENISIKTIGSFTIYEALAPDEDDATEKNIKHKWRDRGL